MKLSSNIRYTSKTNLHTVVLRQCRNTMVGVFSLVCKYSKTEFYHRCKGASKHYKTVVQGCFIASGIVKSIAL